MIKVLNKSLFLKKCFGFSSGGRVQVGFIGLGNMGGPMSLNLLNSKKYDVLAFDTNTSIQGDYKAKGIQFADNVQQIAKNCETVITMLPNHHLVKKVCEGPEGLFSNLKKNGLVIDCSTIDLQAAIELNKTAQSFNVNYVDAPVSGGVGAATAGTLTFMVGSGNEQIFNRAQAYLQFMGKKVINCKKEGAGQIAKACNNMALAIEMIAVSEAMTLGKKLGIDSKVLAEIMNVSSSYCWSSQVYNPCPGILENVPSSKNYDGGFASELMLKDLGIASAAAKNSGSSIPLGTMSKQIYEQIVKDGKARKDFSIVYQYLLENKI